MVLLQWTFGHVDIMTFDSGLIAFVCRKILAAK